MQLISLHYPAQTAFQQPSLCLKDKKRGVLSKVPTCLVIYLLSPCLAVLKLPSLLLDCRLSEAGTYFLLPVCRAPRTRGSALCLGFQEAQQVRAIHNKSAITSKRLRDIKPQNQSANGSSSNAPKLWINQWLHPSNKCMLQTHIHEDKCYRIMQFH